MDLYPAVRPRKLPYAHQDVGIPLLMPGFPEILSSRQAARTAIFVSVEHFEKHMPHPFDLLHPPCGYRPAVILIRIAIRPIIASLEPEAAVHWLAMPLAN